MYDLRPFLRKVTDSVLAHALPGVPGAYSRWPHTHPDYAGNTVYGNADAIHVLYTLNALPPDAPSQQALIAQLQSFQDPADGLFKEAPLHPLHTTAFAAGALELLNARPLHPAPGLRPYQGREGLLALLESLDWRSNPWGEAHRGAGVYAAVLLAGAPAHDWEDAYFSWLWDNQDASTGLWRTGCIHTCTTTPPDAPLFHHLASSFHYLFNHDYARRPLAHGEALAQTCLRMARENALPPTLGEGFSWNEIDWAYTLRSLQKRGSAHSAALGVLLRKLADTLLPRLLALDPAADEGVQDLHTLFAGLSALAVLQEALPGLLRTERPLRLVLDRKPFL